MSELSESEVRALRDAVYGPCTDKAWDACKNAWMNPDSIEWLIEKAAKGSQ
jgi:hypothetical protein